MDVTEKKFREWLDDKEIPYWYIHQDVETFSEALKRMFVKRPDFMILIPNFTFILVDVKCRKPPKEFADFRVDYGETKKYWNLQRLVNVPVWYVFTNEGVHYKTWYWIAVSEVLAKGIPFMLEGEEKGYYAVDMENFHQIGVKDDLGRLFVSMLKK
jgi:hypothetical protein